jgi:hypothetical protein
VTYAEQPVRTLRWQARQPLSDAAAEVVRSEIRQVCAERRWRLHSLDIAPDAVALQVACYATASTVAQHCKGRSSWALGKHDPDLAGRIWRRGH